MPLPFLKLKSSHLKSDGWKTFLSFWGGVSAYFSGEPAVNALLRFVVSFPHSKKSPVLLAFMDLQVSTQTLWETVAGILIRAHKNAL